MEEIDVEGLQANKQINTEDPKIQDRPRYWEFEDALPGSTSESLAVVENGEKVRVHGPTHYHHLADGRVLAHFNGGTHHTEPGPDGRDKITKIIAIHEG